jgi:hypothetical protein
LFAGSLLVFQFNQDLAWKYCCSIGMRPVEAIPALFNEIIMNVIIRKRSNVVIRNYGIIFFKTKVNAQSLNLYLYLGETFQINRTTDAWCRSKIIVQPEHFYTNTYIEATCTAGPSYIFNLFATRDGTFPGLMPPKASQPSGLRFACDDP